MPQEDEWILLVTVFLRLKDAYLNRDIVIQTLEVR